MSKTNTRKQISKNSKHKSGVAQSILFSLLIGTIFLILAALLSSLILKNTGSPESFIPYFAIVCGMISGAACGICSAKMTGKAMPWSAVSGILMVFVLFIISLFFKAENEPDLLLSVIYCAGIVLVSLLAGIFSSKKKTTKKVR